MTDRLDSTLLRTFLAVAETGSMSAAADRVLRSQSAVSLQIKQLETIVGQRLFERHGRGVRPTAPGKKLFPVANRAIRLLDDALDGFRPDAMRGELRIGIPDEFAARVLPNVLGGFARAHPRVELTVRCALSALFPEALRKGELDLAVFDTDRLQPGQRLIRRQRAVWAASRRHAAQFRDPVPLALFDRACWWRDSALAALRRASRDYSLACTSESNAGIVAAIEAGVGVGLLPEDSMTADMLELTEVDGFPPMPETLLVINRAANVDPALAEAMSDAIAAAFDQERSPVTT